MTGRAGAAMAARGEFRQQEDLLLFRRQVSFRIVKGACLFFAVTDGCARSLRLEEMVREIARARVCM